jgi:hypothetical protein
MSSNFVSAFMPLAAPITPFSGLPREKRRREEREVLVHNVIHYVPVILPNHHLLANNVFHFVPITPPPPPPTVLLQNMFKKSTAPYKVHNIGLRDINIHIFFILCSYLVRKMLRFLTQK